MAQGEMLAGLLSEVTDRHADLPALIERDGERLESITFAELSAAVAALAGELRGRGVARADVVGVWLPKLDRDGRVGVRARLARRCDARRQHALQRARADKSAPAGGPHWRRRARALPRSRLRGAAAAR